MALVGAWLMTVMMLEFAVGGFLLFAARGIPWYKRLVGAFIGLGCGIIFVAFANDLLSGNRDNLVEIEPGLLVFAFLFVNVFGFQLVDKLVKRPEGFGCFGTLLRLAGCAVVGWASFALVVLGLALLMGLVVALD